jgi:serine phosphatase RsbU (regulator of sigma subunit)
LSAICAIGILLFCYLSLIVPWFSVAFSFLLCSIWQFSAKMQHQHRLERDAEIVKRSHAVTAQAVQQALIRDSLDISGVSVKGYYKSADITGGDWYGVYGVEDRIYAFIGDVTGHGFSSALVTGTIAGTVDTCLAYFHESGISMEDSVHELNKRLHQTMLNTGVRARRFMTMAIICIDYKTRECLYLNRAHNCIFVVGGGEARALLVPGSHLGGISNTYKVRKFRIKEDDIIFLYTDGLIENSSPTGKVLRIRELSKVISKESTAEGVLLAALEAGKAIWQDHPPEDDCALVAIKIGA